MRITSKGQVAIPRAIREKVGLLSNTEVEFEPDGKSVRIRKAKAERSLSSTDPLIKHLRAQPGDKRHWPPSI